MEYIEKIFKKTGWISILESVIFAILGAKGDAQWRTGSYCTAI